MNRQERRRLKIKGKAATLNINSDAVEAMKQKATRDGAKIAFFSYVGHSNYGDP